MKINKEQIIQLRLLVIFCLPVVTAGISKAIQILADVGKVQFLYGICGVGHPGLHIASSVMNELAEIIGGK